jgi:ribulose-phosphate 3-epimerase
VTVALRVAGSLWSAPPQQVVDEAVRLAEAGLTCLHWDLTDGEFAVPGGFAADRAARVTAVAGVGAEAHLMVREPLAHIDAWTGFCELVTVHVESQRWCAAVDRIACRGAVPAVAVSPGPPPRRSRPTATQRAWGCW